MPTSRRDFAQLNKSEQSHLIAGAFHPDRGVKLNKTTNQYGCQIQRYFRKLYIQQFKRMPAKMQLKKKQPRSFWFMGRIPYTKKLRRLWMRIWRWQWKLAWSRARAQMMNWNLSTLGCFIIKASPRNAIHSFTLQLWSNNVSNLESRKRSAIWMAFRRKCRESIVFNS